MNCDRVKELLNDYIDDLLDGDRRGPVEEHLVSCSDCAARLDGLRRVVAGVRGLKTIKAPAALRTGVMARISAPRYEDQSRSRPLPSTRIVLVPLAAAALLLAALTLVFVLYEPRPESDADLVAAVDADIENRLKSLGYAGEGRHKDQGALGEKSIRDGLDEESLPQTAETVGKELSKRSEAKPDAGRAGVEAQSRHDNKLRLAELARAKEGPESGVKLPSGSEAFNCLLVETESDLGEAAKRLGTTQFGGRAVVRSSRHYAWGASREVIAGELAVLLEVEALNYRELLPTLTTSRTVAVYGCVIEDLSTPPEKTKGAVDKEPSSQTGTDRTRLPVLATVWTRLADEIDSFGRKEELEESEKIPDYITSALSKLVTRAESDYWLRFKPEEDLAILSDEEKKDEIRASEISSDRQEKKNRILIIFVRSRDPPSAGPSPARKKEDK